MERVHHRSLVHEARENLQLELAANRKRLQGDVQNIVEAKSQMGKNLEVLRERRDKPGSHGSALFALRWNNLSDAAWRTARDTGALGYMAQTDVRDLAGLYAMQQEVEQLASNLLLAQARAAAPLLIEQDKPSVAQINEALSRTADDLTQLDVLGQVLEQLAREYEQAARSSH